MINYLPFMQIQKEDRSYILLLPFNAPYDECHKVMLEFAEQILADQKAKQEAADQERLKKEMVDQTAEAAG